MRSLINLLFALLLIALGALFIALPNTPDLRQNLFSLIEADRLILQSLGLSVVLLGAILIVSCFLVGKRKHYLVVMGRHGHVKIDETILQQYVENYFKQLFPGFTPHIEANILRGKIRIFADLPEVHYGEQRELLEKIEIELHTLFQKKFGYSALFHLNISFA